MSLRKTIIPSAEVVSAHPDINYYILLDMVKQIPGMTQVDNPGTYAYSLESGYAMTYFKHDNYDFYFAVQGKPEDSGLQTSAAFGAMTADGSRYCSSTAFARNTSVASSCRIYYIALSDLFAIQVYPEYSTNSSDVVVVWKEDFSTLTSTLSSTSTSISVRSPLNDEIRIEGYSSINNLPYGLDSSNLNRSLILPILWTVSLPDYELYSKKIKRCHSRVVTTTDRLSEISLNGNKYIHLTGPFIIPYTESTS